MRRGLSNASRERLAGMYGLLRTRLREGGGSRRVRSGELGRLLDAGEASVRKDLSQLRRDLPFDSGGGAAGYDVPRLLWSLGRSLGFDVRRRVCVVGLGRLGTTLLRRVEREDSTFILAAVFDSSPNRLELCRTGARRHLTPEIESVVRELGIEVAILAAPRAQDLAERLVSGGARGIVNYGRGLVRPPRPGIRVRNVDLTRELYIIASHLGAEGERNG